MKLPIRIEYDGETFEDVELREMSGADIAEVKKIGSNGDIYSAFLAFAVCATKSLGDVEDKTRIREIYKNATFDSIYAVAVQGMALTRGIEVIEGRYKCKCGNIVEHVGDFADPLPQYESMDCDDVNFTFNKVEITNKKDGSVLFSAEKILFRRPRVKDLIFAYRKYPDDDGDMHFELYKNCILQVDDKEISDKDRNAYGDLIFKKMKYGDLVRLSEEISIGFGKVECVCMKCKRRWKAEYDLTNFFDSEVD